MVAFQANKLVALMQAQGYSLTTLAEEAGVTYDGLRKLVVGERVDPLSSTVVKLAAALHVPIETFFEEE